MDPTELTPEEQVARYDEIIGIVAEEPADDAGKIGQYVQIAAVVNRPADGGGEEDPAPEVEDDATAEEGDEEEPADDEEDKEAKAGRTRGKAKANPHAAAIAASKEGQANPAAALKAIAAGLTLAQFKAMAPALGKGAGRFASRMDNEDGSRRLNADTSRGGGGGKVVKLKSPNEYYARAQGGGGKK